MLTALLSTGVVPALLSSCSEAENVEHEGPASSYAEVRAEARRPLRRLACLPSDFLILGYSAHAGRRNPGASLANSAVFVHGGRRLPAGALVPLRC